MKVTVIGGSGFIGTRITGYLLKKGYEVCIADKNISKKYPELWKRCDVRNGSYKKDEFAPSIIDRTVNPGLHEESVSKMPMQSLEEVIAGSDVVINLAAEHRDDVTPKSLYDDVNVTGSANVCSACTNAGVKKIIFTSTVAVYGFAAPGTDETGAIKYFNDYGRTKYLAEQKYGEWVKSSDDNKAVIIRPTVVFGEDNRGNVYNLLHQIARGRFPMVGKGTNRKSMNYVENVVAFIEYEITHDTEHGVYLYNYCDEPVYDMNHLVLDCYRILGRPKKRLFHWPYGLALAGGRFFDLLAKVLHKKLVVSSIRVTKFTKDTYFVGSNIKKTDFKAPVSLEEGLRRTIEYEFLGKTHC